MPLAPLYEIVSGSGDIELDLSGEPDARLALTTGSGAIECLLPIEITDVTRNRLAGITGRGRSEIRLETGSGDLRVSRTD